MTPEVVYLAPKPFNRNRLILHLATVVAVVLALLLGLSIFFKVGRVEVSGCSQYTPWQVQQASGIEIGDQLLTFSVPRAVALIRSELPYVKTVRIGITLPDTVNIEIVETRVTYALADPDGNWWLMDSDGKIVEQAAAGKETDHTVISGLIIEPPIAGGQAQAREEMLPTTLPDATQPPVTVTAAQRLTVLLQLATYLEQNGIIGDIASIDLTNLYDMELWYGDQFHVLLGDTVSLDTKIRYLKGFADDYTANRPYESGLLDISDPEWIEYQSFVENTG